MMVRWIVATALSCGISTASAQTIVDGSGGDIKPARLQHVLVLASDLFKDPESTRFRRIVSRYKGILVCGEVNSKNAYGAYTGYVRFMVVNAGVPKLMSPAGDKNRAIDEIVFEKCDKPEAGEVKDPY